VPGPAEEQLRVAARRWAEETALAQGLPVKVTDPVVLRDVAVLLGLKPQTRQTGASRDGSKRL
jgi:hypothetical protein